MRIGKISSIDYQGGTARVTFPDCDGETTGNMPLLDFYGTPPSVGDAVLTCRLDGSSTGVILGRLWAGVQNGGGS